MSHTRGWRRRPGLTLGNFHVVHLYIQSMTEHVLYQTKPLQPSVTEQSRPRGLTVALLWRENVTRAPPTTEGVKLPVHLPPWWMMRSRSGSPSNVQAQERKQLCVLSRFRSVSRNADSPQNVRFMYMLYGSIFLFVSLVFKYSQNSRGIFPPDFAIFILWRQF